MRMIGRLALLWFAAVLTMTMVVAIGLGWDSISQSWLRDSESFWIRLRAVPVIHAATLTAVFSAMLPNALFGHAAINRLERGEPEIGAVDRANEALEAFMATSLICIPLLVVFPPDEGNLWRAEHMSRSQYLWSFLAVWLVHGALNAIAVIRRRRRLAAV